MTKDNKASQFFKWLQDYCNDREECSETCPAYDMITCKCGIARNHPCEWTFK